MPTTTKTLKQLRDAMKKAEEQTSLERRRSVGQLEEAFLSGKAEGIRVAQRLVEMLCQ